MVPIFMCGFALENLVGPSAYPRRVATRARAICTIQKSYSDAGRCDGESAKTLVRNTVRANNEHGAPKRPLNEPFVSDFVKCERAETLKREKNALAGPFYGHDGEKRGVQLTDAADAADLEIDTRNMTLVFFRSRRYNRRERLGKRGKEEVASSRAVPL